MLREGKRIRTRFLDVRFSVSPFPHPGKSRIGLIVPKAKHSAVERNKLKRRLRELARTVLIPGKPSHDIVLIARATTYDATFELLRLDIDRIGHELQPGNES